MEKRQTSIPGCFELNPHVHLDERGGFIKTFHRKLFSEMDLVRSFDEEYYSFSKKNVIRGMHFQLPPMDHEKIVYCVHGAVFDVVVDLRVDSPSFRNYEVFHLSGNKGNIIFLPKGVAHGFLSLQDDTVVMYKVTSLYHKERDTGIRWDSVGVSWPVEDPIVSARDQSFVRLDEFNSPFRVTEGG